MARAKRHSGGGKGYRIHEQKGLPPLAFYPEGPREELHRQQAIKSLLELKADLLTSDFRTFFHQVVDLDSQLQNYLSRAKVQACAQGAPLRLGYAAVWLHLLCANRMPELAEHSQKQASPASSGRLRDYDLANTWVHALDNFRWKSSERQEFTDELVRHLAQAMRNAVENLSNRLEDEVHNYEEKTAVELSILETTALYLCKNCHQIFSIGRHKNGECWCGKRIETSSQVTKIAIRHLNHSARSFWEENTWFEEGVAYALRKEGFECQTGILILGGSGMDHEIDVLAEKVKDRKRILVECKTSNIKKNDLFILAGKMRDIGVSRGLLVYAEGESSSDIGRLAAANGIVVIAGVLDNDSAFVGLE